MAGPVGPRQRCSPARDPGTRCASRFAPPPLQSGGGRGGPHGGRRARCRALEPTEPGPDGAPLRLPVSGRRRGRGSATSRTWNPVSVAARRSADDGVACRGTRSVGRHLGEGLGTSNWQERLMTATIRRRGRSPRRGPTWKECRTSGDLATAPLPGCAAPCFPLVSAPARVYRGDLEPWSWPRRRQMPRRRLSCSAAATPVSIFHGK